MNTANEIACPIVDLSALPVGPAAVAEETAVLDLPIPVSTRPPATVYPIFREAGNGRFYYAYEESVLRPGVPNWSLRSYTLAYAKKLAARKGRTLEREAKGGA